MNGSLRAPHTPTPMFRQLEALEMAVSHGYLVVLNRMGGSLAKEWRK